MNKNKNGRAGGNLAQVGALIAGMFRSGATEVARTINPPRTSGQRNERWAKARADAWFKAATPEAKEAIRASEQRRRERQAARAAARVKGGR